MQMWDIFIPRTGNSRVANIGKSIIQCVFAGMG